MKKFFTLLLALALYQETSFTYERIARLETPDKLITYIGKQNFVNRTGYPASSGTELRGTFSITNPGVYVLTEDIQSNVGGGETIYISSDHVTLDLGGKTVYQHATAIGTDVHGINVAANVDNLEIRNGTLSNIQGSGILVTGAATNIRIKDM